MATVWFGDSQRAIATSIGCLALPMGDILGFAITPVFVSDKDPLPEVKQRVITYCLWAAVMVSVFSLPMVCFFREKPQHFPSVAAKSISKTEYGFKKDLYLLIKNTNFWLVSICAGC